MTAGRANIATRYKMRLIGLFGPLPEYRLPLLNAADAYRLHRQEGFGAKAFLAISNSLWAIHSLLSFGTDVEADWAVPNHIASYISIHPAPHRSARSALLRIALFCGTRRSGWWWRPFWLSGQIYTPSFVSGRSGRSRAFPGPSRS